MLDRDRLDAIVNAICERLDGEWLLVGGALVSLWLESRRTTEDVDVLGLDGSARERLALLELGDSLGLPVEALNSAADFFVKRIPDWRDHLVLFRKGPKGSVFRPDGTLFLLLKLRRLDERDLEDCRALVDAGEPFDRARVLSALDRLPPPADDAVSSRREILRTLMQ